MTLQDAIEHYHGLLDDELAEESHARLNDQLRTRGLFFGDRPLCSVLRPRFFTPAQYAYLQKQSQPLLQAFDKAHRAAMEDRTFRVQFRLFDWEESLLADDPGFAEPTPVSRLDAFFVSERGGLRFTEYNAETPAAASYGDVLTEVFLGLPVMREFLRTWQVRTLPARHHVMHALLDAWRQWSGGARRSPRVVILDWREVPTWSEFVITAEYLRSQGLECTIGDPRDAEYDGNELRVDGRPVDLIYKRVLISELIERGGLNHPVVRAVRERKACMVNPFRCKLLHKKASLAVLGDERNADLFSRTEHEAIEAHIPWTRVVEERRTQFRGESVDLLEFAAANRERLVLKPNDEYGGTGIVLGWHCDDAAWSRALKQALDEPMVIQERVVLPEESYPSMVDGRVHFTDRVLDTAPFVFRGSYVDGCLTRLSTEPLVNVTAGGGSSLATMIVERR